MKTITPLISPLSDTNWTSFLYIYFFVPFSQAFVMTENDERGSESKCQVESWVE